MLGKLLSLFRGRSDAWHLQDIHSRVERNGWTAMYIGDYDASPTWAYTIGFQRTVSAPEVIAFDIPMETANAVFWEIYQEIRSGELVIRDGERWRADDGVMMWRRVHPSRFIDDPENPWLALAHDFHHIVDANASDFDAYQLVLSDAEGHLPWEPGYDERLRPRQRALWEPVELAPTAAV